MRRTISVVLLALVVSFAASAAQETSKIATVGITTELIPPTLPEGIVFIRLVDPGASAACFNNQGVLRLLDTERDSATKAYATALTAKAADLTVRVTFSQPDCDLEGITIVE